MPVVAVVAGTWVLAMALLSAVVVLAQLAPAEVPGGPELGWWAWSVGLVALTVQALLLRSTALAPGRSLVLVSAVAPVAAGAGLGAATGATSVAVLVAAYVVTLETPWPRAVPSLVAAAVLVAVGEGVRAGRDSGLTLGGAGTAVLQGAGTVAVATAVGLFVAARRETGRARTEQLRALAGEQAARTEAAVARQRTAMARELHDIAAHHLSGIAVMTAALDRQIDTDPAGAKVAVRQVRQQSTAMLRDLRQLVAMLREDDPGAAPRGVEPETLGGLRRLVDDARSAGRDVGLSVLGVPADRLADLAAGPLAQLAAYRTVQESLANAARHAPGARCEVVVDARDTGHVVVTVRNDAPTAPPPVAPVGAGGGLGIVGMRERAELTDARLTTGPTPQGGFLVSLTLPVSTEEPT